MAVLVSYYSGILSDALTIGAVIGALAGVIAFTASTASEGVQRVIVGFVVGGVIMGVIQAFLIAGAAGVGTPGGTNPLLRSQAGAFGGALYEGLVRTLQAALAGGLLAVISLAPFKAFTGALAGVAIGVVSAFVAWGVLQYVDAPIPIVIFYLLILGLVLFVIENIPARGA